MPKRSEKTITEREEKNMRSWQATFANKCQREDFKANPGDAWKMVFKLIKGFQGHHCSFCQMNFKDKRGNIAKNNKDNLKILGDHYHEVFNREVPTDLSIHWMKLNNCQLSTKQTCSNENEILEAINGMKNNKTPGTSGLTTGMLKSIPPDAFNLFTKLIQGFWNNKDTNYDSWHATKLSNL